MKRILGLVVLAALGVVVAGCASARKTVVHSVTITKPVPSGASVVANGVVTVTGTVTLRNLEPGTSIACKGGPRVKIPAGEARAGATSFQETAVSGPARPTSLQLSRSVDGTVTVSCSRK
jgi:hypothetical protein